MDAQTLGQSGMRALQEGDGQKAVDFFQRLLDLGAPHSEDRDVWLALAMAHQAAGGQAEAAQAASRVLERDPRNIRACLIKADALVAQGDKRAALGFYKIVFTLAPDPGQYPPAVADEIKRAKDVHDDISAQMLAHVKSTISEDPQANGRRPTRIAKSIALLAGERTRYEERPRAYFVPELPAIEFYDPGLFDWAADIEAAVGEIEAELTAALKDGAPFEPYIAAHVNQPIRRDHNLLDSRDWDALFLCKDGVADEALAKRFAKTLAALQSAPLEVIENRGPMILFSRLRPGARIEPHTGFLNTRLICHLPIITQGDCALRVGNDVHQWRKGELVVFSDAIEHEAWNNSDEDRIVLIFSIWRPDLSAEEREQISALLQSIDSFS